MAILITVVDLNALSWDDNMGMGMEGLTNSDTAPAAPASPSVLPRPPPLPPPLPPTMPQPNPPPPAGVEVQSRWLTYLLLAWAIGGCFAEYNLLAPSRQRLYEELLSVVRKDMPSHYRNDFFNWVRRSCK